MNDKAHRLAVVALLGAPNAGKSTLLNALIGAKVAIVTHKVQTTRARLRGLLVEDDTQLVFIDTPGIFQPKRTLERAMVKAAWQAVEDADRLCLIYDAERGPPDEGALAILKGIADAGRKVIVVLNKIDRVQKPRLMPIAEAFGAHPAVERIFMISAEKGDGLADLKSHLLTSAKPGEWLFPEDELTDQPLRLMAAEITREKLFLNLHQELPYSLTVETEDWKDLADGSARIAQIIYVMRDGHRGIVIGQGGRTIKAVRQQAQRDLEAFLERPVHLFLEVKVSENWAEDPARLKPWGLDPKA